jgi:hypothetical protein
MRPSMFSKRTPNSIDAWVDAYGRSAAADSLPLIVAAACHNLKGIAPQQNGRALCGHVRAQTLQTGLLADRVPKTSL